ncbi:UDP-glycosyltransferase 74F2-like isoform X2 [Rhododendron vialii]|uniref:UDP-glycosyltransferase 74F2-like isoform X2 n=1 Tax=Rhododendron vialii TaxID=182163 RepID=UPI00265F25B6|nr:UDP-glycosyltransferase 74F2-like isoform X2 [Rhododendron vialii]
MEKGRRSSTVHVLALPYPTQGHLNPMVQFCWRLVSKRLKATLAITTFVNNTMQPKSGLVQLDTISDGYDEGGFKQAGDTQAYLSRFEVVGSKTLAELIKRHGIAGQPVDCVIYDSFLPWALDVAKQHGIAGASFFTQPCAVNYIYHQAHYGLLTLPVPSLPISIPGLPLLELEDMPSFIYVHGSYPAYFEMVLSQFSNVEKADYVVVNTFYKLEEKVVDAMSKVSPMLTIGPTIPSFYLDKRVQHDKDYGLNLFKLDPSVCLEWLSNKPKRSVVYVSFGSLSNISPEQTEELARGLKGSNLYFLWVVRDSEEAKLPEHFVEETSDKGLVVGWSPQLEVLASEAVGCFFSHCGWNSTIEALSLGVPMVVMPQWTDQTTNAKFVQDVWKVGIRVKMDEKGVVGRKEVENCIREVMEGEKGKEMMENCIKWKVLAREAVCEGGTSDKDIDEFVSKLTKSLC